MKGIREERGVRFRSSGLQPHRRPSSKGAVFCIAGMMIGALVGSFCQRRRSDPSSFGMTLSASAERRRGIPPYPSSSSSSRPSSSSSDPDPEAPWPRIAWLMSFPNSGTTFTLELVGNASLRYPASNYGERGSIVVDAAGNSSTMIPVLHGSSIGPFWHGPSSSSDPSSGEATSSGGVVKRPEVGEIGYVLTKTHCGNRCVMCGPSRYMETQHQFQRHCLETKHVDAWKENVSAAYTTAMSFEHAREERPHYDTTVVQRAVHLVRNPFDNVVARFRYYQKHHPDQYTRDRGGFREFCSDLNRRYKDKEEQSTLLERSILDVIGHVPCHGAFIAYVMWHNHAFTTTRNMQLPTLVVHYEDFETGLDRTLAGLLDFLRLDFVGRRIEFIAREDYSDYFTQQEIADVKVALKELAYLETWQNIERYFSR